MPTDAPSSSGGRTLFVLILLGIGILAFLQFAGMVNVVGKSETEQIIQRPHDPR